MVYDLNKSFYPWGEGQIKERYSWILGKWLGSHCVNSGRRGCGLSQVGGESVERSRLRRLLQETPSANCMWGIRATPKCLAYKSKELWLQEEKLIWKEGDKIGFGFVESRVLRGHRAGDDQRAGSDSRNLVKGLEQWYLLGDGNGEVWLKPGRRVRRSWNWVKRKEGSGLQPIPFNIDSEGIRSRREVNRKRNPSRRQKRNGREV